MKKDIFKHGNKNYAFISFFGMKSKIYGRGKERILVEDDRVLLYYSDPKARRVNV
ncbi:MAG: hypothetical protein ACTSYJ_00565 [Candidatus Thorarchaeota archaeon]